MSSYRIARRSFLRGVGAGGIGLKLMLRNLEASAAGMGPPPRFLMTHWPVGAIKYRFLPSATGTNFNFSTSPILQPFESLKSDMIVLYGLQTSIISGGPGGHEAGTVKSSTGANSPGNRVNGGEGDDAVSGGPSWDQIFLKHVPELYRAASGAGYVNAICDARVDSLETSTQCLSYDYLTGPVAGVGGGTLTQNLPLLPVLSPLALFNKLFMNFMPGGGTGGMEGNVQALNLLRARKSVLDHATNQLARLKTLCPGSELSKIDAHANAIRKIETQLSQQINSGVITPAKCTPPDMPSPTLTGKTGSKFDYKTPGTGPTSAASDDSVAHAEVAKAHMGIIRTAFQCDLIRVATFQFSPGTNHVSFKGLYPGDANGIYMHHPTSHQVTSATDSLGSLPPAGYRQDTINFLVNVHRWYNERMAEMLALWKTTTDIYGGNLLANTIVPYITEVAETSHSQGSMPALIFGGSNLGMIGGQYQNFEGRPRSYNEMWLSIAQAYFKSATPLDKLPAATEKFRRPTAPGVIPGLWAAR
jgi:hypothetical protein